MTSAMTDERRRLMNVAYRLLGSVTDAEDVVQEAYARWCALSRVEQDAIDNPGAWLTTVAGRICLDLLRSARARREQYVGQWLPEPLPPEHSIPDPADRVTLDESVSMAFLVLLESMTPPQRVAFILHDVFGYSFAEVAEVVGRSPTACRQLASIGRRRIQEEHRRRPAPGGQAAVVRDFRRAWEANDIAALIGLLDPDARATADGGGWVSAQPQPVAGGQRIAHGLIEIAAQLPGMTLLERTVNGRPGLVVRQEETTVAVFAFDMSADRILHIWAMLNPAKLRGWVS
jgi:RNA polymerase sigma factor (sigma-70 family)